MSSSVSAAFDALVITDALDRSADGAAAAELHVLAYLACLISFYDNRHPDAWAYGFSATPAGAPYAHVLAEECDRLRAAGRLLDEGEVLVLSSAGAEDLEALAEFSSCRARLPYVEAACASATLRPLPTVADALAYEPQLQRALDRRAPRQLLTPTGLMLVDGQLRAVARVLGERSPIKRDLLVPTTIWLNYLRSSGEHSAESPA
jgi:hypothetical protein